MSARAVPIVVVLLAALGALGGWGVAPFVARQNDTVRLAERVALEDAEDLPERTLESDAWRGLGEPTASLYARAHAAERRIAVAGVVFGIWCGLVVGLKLFAASRPARADEYSIDHALCMACGRCFLSCPREHLRLKRRRGELPAEEGPQPEGADAT